MLKMGRFGTRRFGMIGLALLAGVSISLADGSRIDELNQRFLEHLAGLERKQALPVATIREAWEREYQGSAPESFVPDALAVLNEDYASALRAFDASRLADAERELHGLLDDADPYVAANAAYFYARTLIDRRRFEQAEQFLRERVLTIESIERYAPFADHLRFLLGVCESRNLHYKQAAASLGSLSARADDLPEMIRVGVRQLLLELDRREQGTLGEVATVMDYVSDRFHVADPDERVRERQDEILAMLDKLIEEHEQQEQQQSSSSGGTPGGQGSPKGGQPSKGKPRDESSVAPGAGKVGDLHAAPDARPGDAWGKLPAAEREKILQVIRERFPSRYRQLVEQYYRSLAEENE